MDNSINSLNFKANIVTKMKGRQGIMEPVAKEFSKLTQNIQGELNISRNLQDYPGAIVLSLKDGNSYILHDYADLMGNNLESGKSVTKTLVNKIAKTFVNIFKALKADSEFCLHKELLEEKIKFANRELRTDKHFLRAAEVAKDDNNAKAFRILIKKDRERIAILNNELANLKDKYEKNLNLQAEREPKLTTWRDVIIDEIRNR